ncbi:MAG: cyclodeaminase/cyclohydrolase family protein [Candidatus Omnitrophica bacterium]|nr:cyclodeaminase/cyclohydrolase family protein [Candidatus Omnitrophota bacterium]
MKYRDKFKQFLKDLSKDSPSPGGGSASALVFCLGVSLMVMAINFSFDKNKPILVKVKKRLEKIRAKVFPYIDWDGEFFNQVLKEKDSLKRKIHLENLVNLTYDLGCSCVEVLDITKISLPYIKKSIISDFYIGLEMVKVSLFSSIKNLEANKIMFGIRESKKIDRLKLYLNKFKRWQNY